jgi:hypothetical protein
MGHYAKVKESDFENLGARIIEFGDVVEKI